MQVEEGLPEKPGYDILDNAFFSIDEGVFRVLRIPASITEEKTVAASFELWTSIVHLALLGMECFSTT